MIGRARSRHGPHDRRRRPGVRQRRPAQGVVGLPHAASPDPLGERLTLMWHNHFATSNLKVHDLVVDAPAERARSASTPAARSASCSTPCVQRPGAAGLARRPSQPQGPPQREPGPRADGAVHARHRPLHRGRRQGGRPRPDRLDRRGRAVRASPAAPRRRREDDPRHDAAAGPATTWCDMLLEHPATARPAGLAALRDCSWAKAPSSRRRAGRAGRRAARARPRRRLGGRDGAALAGVLRRRRTSARRVAGPVEFVVGAVRGAGAVRPAAEHAAAGRLGGAAGAGPVLPAQRRRLAGRPGLAARSRACSRRGELRRGPGRRPALDAGRRPLDVASARGDVARHGVPSPRDARRLLRRAAAGASATAGATAASRAAGMRGSERRMRRGRSTRPDALVRRRSASPGDATHRSSLYPRSYAMFTRRDFLRHVARCSLWPRPCRRSSPARAAAAGPGRDGRVAGRRPARRRQRRHQHRRPLRRRGLRQAPPDAAPADATGCVKVERPRRPAPVACARSASCWSGRLAIVQGVGYPNPSRSHFASMAIWQTARLDAEEHDGYGWLGRALDARPRRAERRRRRHGLRRRRPAAGGPARPAQRRLGLGAAGRLRSCSRRRRGPAEPAPDAPTTTWRRSSAAACSTPTPPPTALAQASPAATAAARYPDTQLAERLRLVARLLKAGRRARLLHLAGRLRHPRRPGRSRTPAAGRAAGGAQGVPRRPAAAKLADRVGVLASASSAGRSRRTARPAPTTAPPGRSSWPGRPARGGLDRHEPPSLTDLGGGDRRWPSTSAASMPPSSGTGSTSTRPAFSAPKRSSQYRFSAQLQHRHLARVSLRSRAYFSSRNRRKDDIGLRGYDAKGADPPFGRLARHSVLAAVHSLLREFLLAMVVAWHASTGLLHLGLEAWPRRLRSAFSRVTQPTWRLSGCGFTSSRRSTRALLRETPDEIETIHPIDDRVRTGKGCWNNPPTKTKRPSPSSVFLSSPRSLERFSPCSGSPATPRWYLGEVYVDGGKVAASPVAPGGNAGLVSGSAASDRGRRNRPRRALRRHWSDPSVDVPECRHHGGRSWQDLTSRPADQDRAGGTRSKFHIHESTAASISNCPPGSVAQHVLKQRTR